MRREYRLLQYIATPVIHQTQAVYLDSAPLNVSTATPDVSLFYAVDGGATMEYSGVFPITCTGDVNLCNVTVLAWVRACSCLCVS